ncbi:cytochrome P450 [Suillus spraguei]|nr:cytochrome P450 [Suillus spraguei]
MFEDRPGLQIYLATSALALASFAYCRKYWLNDPSRPPLPPGPTPLPIVGNILSLDAARPWLTFDAWKSTYGNIIYARLLNKPVIVINSEGVAKNLLEERSTIYSDRPQSFVYEYFASDFNVGLMPYGDKWRLHRRVFHQAFRQAVIPTYHAVQLRAAHKMLFNLLQDPGNYPSHFQMFIMSLVLPIVYDYDPKAKDDHIVDAITRYVDLVGNSLAPGPTVLMETFPFLLQLPTWFPGATFKRASVKCIQAGHDAKNFPFDYIQERMATGNAASCFVTDTLNRMEHHEEKDSIAIAVKEAATVAYGAAAETSTSTLLVFLLAMILHPEAQAKAQAEIDQVIGKDRLPNFDDRQALPYVEAIFRETLRWYPVVPFGVPHATTTSDIYDGYFIPEASDNPDCQVSLYLQIHGRFQTFMIMFQNDQTFRAMTRNENKYPSPNEFRPERFLHEDGSLTNDMMLLGFGWGRRNCVGRHLADSSVWIAIVSILASFSIHKAVDEHGMDIPVNPKFSTGISIHPEKFPCSIVPRFADAPEKTLTCLTGLGPSVDIISEF